MENEQVLVIEQLIGFYRGFLENKDNHTDDWKTDFGRWLIDQKSVNTAGAHSGMGKEDTFIGMMLIALSNLTRNRINKLINDSPFSTIMDYQFLMVLDQHESLKKSELITVNYMEMSSGIEVIKRLIKHNWVIEEVNENDKRSKLVAISVEGKGILNQYGGKVNNLYSSFSSGLSSEQKENALHYLEMLTNNNS
jgi:DNA-binding MarR family transcriptional regulator